VFGIVPFRQGLEQADKISSVVSMFVGLAGLAIALISIKALRRHPTDGDEEFWILNGLPERAADDGVVAVGGTAHLPRGYEYGWQTDTAVNDLLSRDWLVPAARLRSLCDAGHIALLRQILASPNGQLAIPSQSGMADSDVHRHAENLVAAGWLQKTSQRYRVPGNRAVPLLVIVLAVVP